MFASNLQVKVMRFDDAVLIGSSFSGLIVLILNVAFPLMIYYILEKLHEKKIAIQLSKYSALVEDYDVNSKVRRCFMIFVIGRRTIQSLGIVFFYYIPILQVLSALIPNMALLILLLVYRPHNRLLLNFTNSFNELTFLGIHSLLIVLAYDDASKFLASKQDTILDGLSLG